MTEKQDVLLARQPIYDTKQSIVAYELLFRENTEVASSTFDGNRATSRVLLSLFTDSDLSTVTDDLPAYINFTAELLNNPPILNTDTIVIEVLEDIEITNELIASLKSLKKKGYTLALDDFVMDPKYQPILPIIDIIKLELPAMDIDQLKQAISHLKQYDLTLLAEKIETKEQFKICLELGCDLFQGYFLSKPEIIKGKKVSANKLAVVNLISQIQAPEADMTELTSIISRDPGLSFKLLKLINSASFKRVNQIGSIHKAVTLLGIDKIKSWASLLALSKLDDKPEALHYIALVRALMCEKLAHYLHPDTPDLFYTVGLLSTLDAFLDQDLAEIILKVSLDQTISKALIKHAGMAGLALKTTISFEQARWQELDWDKLSELGLNLKLINEIHFESSQLAIQLSPGSN